MRDLEKNVLENDIIRLTKDLEHCQNGVTSYEEQLQKSRGRLAAKQAELQAAQDKLSDKKESSDE